ncbi:MAG: hypothetical protein Q9225_004563 [Loekoesia sp. 1 TL-2023]
MSTIQILVKNHSGANRVYFLFVEAPEVSVGPKVFQNVYMASSTVADGTGSATFTCHTDYYAVCGTSPGQDLKSNVRVTTGDSEIAGLCQGGQNGTHHLMTGAPGNSAMFDKPNKKVDCTQKGAFMISSANFLLGNGANQFIGLGGQDPVDSSNIVPIAVVPAQPSTDAYIVPKAIYYISWGTYLPGQIIDVTTIAKPAKLDFTGTAATSASVVHKNDGSWDIKI